MSDMTDNLCWESFDMDMDELFYERIFEEWELSWNLRMKDGNFIWFPKSICELNDIEKIILVPHWLVLKKIEQGELDV